MVHITRRRWVGVVGWPIAGFILMWWAGEQWEAMRLLAASTFQLPSAGRFLGWAFTMIGAGTTFGLAAAYAQSETSRASLRATAVIALLPGFVIVHMSLWLAGVWESTIFPDWLWLFLLDQTTVVTSCVIAGVLVGGRIAHQVAQSTTKPIEAHSG